MGFEIPTRADLPAYEFTIELDDRIYTFRFRRNERMNRWIMDILKEDGVVEIIKGIPVMVERLILERFKNAEHPPGSIIFLDTSGEHMDPLSTDLGTRVLMAYEESA